MFLTDGLDNNPASTKEMSKILKQELYSRNIYSKFSVIGIGEHDADFLGKLTDIGT